MRVLPEIPSLRVLNGWVRRALFASADKPQFRIIHFSIQGNHIHLTRKRTTKWPSVAACKASRSTSRVR
jgi:hypothetical protein